MRRLFDNTGLTGDGATYWFSVLFAAPDPTQSSATAIPSFFSNAGGGNGQSSGFAVSFNPLQRTSAYMDARIGGSIRASANVPGTDYYTGSYLVLGRITFSDTAGQDRLEVWLDPPLTGGPGTPLFNVTGTWVDPGANNSFNMNKYDSPDRSVDEIRLGTTLADVAAVPEPSTLALLAVGLASGGYGFIRRSSLGQPPGHGRRVGHRFAVGHVKNPGSCLRLQAAAGHSVQAQRSPASQRSSISTRIVGIPGRAWPRHRRRETWTGAAFAACDHALL